MARTHEFFWPARTRKKDKNYLILKLIIFPRWYCLKGFVGLSHYRHRRCSKKTANLWWPSHPIASIRPSKKPLNHRNRPQIDLSQPQMMPIALLYFSVHWILKYSIYGYMGGWIDYVCHCRGRVSGSILIFHGLLRWNWGSRAEFIIPGDQSRLMLCLILIDDDSLPALWLSSFFFEGSILEL